MIDEEPPSLHIFVFRVSSLFDLILLIFAREQQSNSMLNAEK